MDYKALLKVYMRHVRNEESITYVEDHYESSAQLPKEQWEELVRLRREVEAEVAAEHAKWLDSMKPSPRSAGWVLRDPAPDPRPRVRLCRDCGGAKVCMSMSCMDDSDHACHHCGGSGEEH